MRILHVNKFLYRRGGAEAYMEDVAALQRKAGHEVAFFGMAHPANVEQPFSGHFPSYLEFDPAPSTLTGKARLAGRMLWSTSAARGLDDVIDAFRPDVAHLHNIYHQLSPSILQPLARGRIPTVMTLHDYKLACPSYLFMAGGEVCEACIGGRFHQAVRRRCKDGSLVASGMLALELAVHTAAKAYETIAVFICPSRFMAAKMTEAGVFPERMRQHPHFIDPSTIQVATAGGQGAVFAGRLAHEKGIDTLIEAVARLPRARLEIAGEGPARETLEALAERRAPGRVRFHGHLAKAALHQLIRSAAVAVLPSRCYENQPLIVLEAFACGVPVVCSDLGGMPELVTPGVDGALAPPNDPEALAEQLEALLANPDRAFSMGRAGRTKVEDQFSPHRHLDRLAEIYAEAGAYVA